MKNTTKPQTILMAVLLLAVLIPVIGYAAVPGQITYQGQLMDTTGNPVPDGGYEMSFTLYGAGGSILWDEQQSVKVTDGIYTVQLGAVSPLDVTVFSGDTVYLGVAIYNAGTSTWETLSPRQQLTSTAYAFQAENTQSLEGYGSADFAPALHEHSGDAITSGTIDEAYIDPDIARDSEITWSHLPDIPPDIADGDQVGITAETDPTVAPSVKDGVSWSELSGIPAGFDDGVDNVGVTESSDYGRSGVASTLYEGTTALGNKYVGKSGSQTITNGSVTVTTPYGMGSTPVTGVKGSAQSDTYGFGVLGMATGSQGYGVYGGASGETGKGVYGEATGYNGWGVYGEGSGYNGKGVYGKGSYYGGVFLSYGGAHSSGVVGQANTTGDFTNYGGYFVASGTTGNGVYGGATGASGVGVYGETSSANGYGGYFDGRGYFSSNVGIGITDPQEKLHLDGDIKIPNNSAIKNAHGNDIFHTGWNSTFGDYTDIKSGYAWDDSGEPVSVVAGANGVFFTKGDDSGNPHAETLMKVSTSGELTATGGIKFTDGTVQTTASAPTWHQILPAAERFQLVMGGEAVLDRETGLVWEQSPDSTTKDWNHAISHCYHREVANRKGWRLPTIEELASLVDNDNSNPSLPSGHPFSNVLNYYYWSSTTSLFDTTQAWQVGFESGSMIGGYMKEYYFPAWCVRGGHGHDAY